MSAPAALLKQILGNLAMPSRSCLLLILAGLFCLWPLRRRGAGRTLLSLGAGLLLLCGHPLVAWALLRPLERAYPPLAATADHAEVAFVAVLGEFHVYDAALPATARLRSSALARLVEGVRVQRMFPASRLVVSGMAPPGDPVPHAEAMAAAAALLGVPPERIVRHPDARDTAGEIAALSALAGHSKVALVTSACHLPRAMALARAAGLDPIPAPTEFLARGGPGGDVWGWVPSGRALHYSELALHEYLGRLWVLLGGR